MDPQTTTLTLVALMSAQVAAALVVRQLVEILKTVWPSLPGDGRQQAFAFSLALYVLVFIAVHNYTTEGAFSAFMAWLGCATSAVGINSLARSPAPVGTTVVTTPAVTTVTKTEVDPKPTPRDDG